MGYVILTVRGQRGTRCILLRGRVRNTLVLPVLLAFMVKLPVFGIHLWLPKAHVQAPVRGRMGLAAVLLKIGGYGIFFIKCLVGVRLSVFLPFIIFSVLGSTIAMMFCMMLDDMKQLQEVVINQQTIPSRGGIHSYGIDLAFLELESNMSSRVFVQSQGSLEGSVSDHHGDIVD